MIDVQKYLALGFEEGQLDPDSGKVDCLGAVACAFRELGWSTERLHPDGLSRSAQQITDDAWELVGREACNATQEGDLILSYPTPSKPHVSVLIDATLGLAFSAFEGHGAMSVRLGTIGQVRGVYRLKEAFR